jgi:hypothetical protein
MDQPINLHSENVYEIVVKGEVNASGLAGLGEVEIQTENLGGEYQVTLFRVVADQTGLVGLIRRLHGLGVVLVSVRICW